MRFRRRIDDPFNPVLLQKTFDQRLICDVTMDKLMSRIPFETLEVRPIAGILERIQVHDVMPALYDQTADQMRADETGAPGDENLHARSSLFAPVRLTN